MQRVYNLLSFLMGGGGGGGGGSKKIRFTAFVSIVIIQKKNLCLPIGKFEPYLPEMTGWIQFKIGEVTQD